MKPYNQRSPIGTVTLMYGEDGTPTSATFNPSALQLEAGEMKRLLSQAKSPEDAVTHAWAVVARWFVEVGNMETADREFNKLESQLIRCEKWPNGAPRLCEVSFYFITTEPKPGDCVAKG